MTENAAMRHLFVAPITTTGNYGFDARNNMVFSYDGERDIGWMSRGWGRIQYLPDGAQLFDAWTLEFNALVRDDMTAQEVCDALNAVLAVTAEVRRD